MSNMDDAIKVILNQNLFDEDYYNDNYGHEIDSDNCLTHYLYLGYKEGKNPSNDFDTLYYLDRYPDLNGMNPLIHYALSGRNEHRFKSLDMELNYIKMGIKSVLDQNLFDETFYMENYGEEIRGMDPFSHYISFGYKEGKNPSPTFETNFYLKKYQDAWNQNPLIHYALYGRKNGYFTNHNQLNPDNYLDKAIKIIKENNLFDCEFYLNHYDDVRKSGKCPVDHYIKSGFYENRKMEPEYDWDKYISRNRLGYDVNPLLHFLLNNNDISNLEIKKSLNYYISNDIKDYLESKYFVSVIMPTYNRKQVIKNAIDSVINQSFSSFELIIVDDGSNDGTENFLKLEYDSLLKNGKIRYIKTNNNGVSKARNMGLNNSNGDVIAYLDSDNIWHDDYLKKMIYVLDKYGCDSCYSAIKVHDNNRMLTKIRESTFNRKRLLKENFIDLNVFMHKKRLFDKFGGFDEQLTRLVDWDLILRYTEESEPYFLNEILADYYLDNSLKNITLTENLDENREKIITKYSSLESNDKRQNKLNIAYVLWDFPSFSQTFIVNELRWLVENEFNVKVFYKSGSDNKAEFDFNLDYSKINNELDLADKLKEYGADIIHTHFVNPTKTPLSPHLVDKLKIPFTISIPTIDIFTDENTKRDFDKLFKSKFCIKIFTLDNCQYKYLVEHGVSNDKILLSKLAVNYFSEQNIQKDNPRFKRGIKNIITISSFLEKDNLDTFIDTANLMKNEEFIFKIYGYGSLDNQIKNKIKELSLKNVKFVKIASKEDVISAYLDGDLFVFMNKTDDDAKSDNMSSFLFEAMGFGIPIISTNVGAISEFIKDNQSGFVINRDSAKCLVRRIKEIKSLSTDKLFSIVHNAQKSIFNISSVENTMDSLLRVWKNDRIGIFLVTKHSEYEEIEKIANILDKIYQYTSSPFDLLVVDNNSDVKFKEFLKNYSGEKENMEVILLNTNILCGPASNIALNKLNNKFVVYLSSDEDLILKPRWELNALNLMENNSNIGIAGNLISYSSLFNENYYKNNQWFKKARNRYFIEREFEKPLKYVKGDCFIIRKKIFEELGGFNPKLPQKHWDVEYSIYIKSEGWKLAQIPNWI